MNTKFLFKFHLSVDSFFLDAFRSIQSYNNSLCNLDLYVFSLILWFFTIIVFFFHWSLCILRFNEVRRCVQERFYNCVSSKLKNNSFVALKFFHLLNIYVLRWIFIESLVWIFLFQDCAIFGRSRTVVQTYLFAGHSKKNLYKNPIFLKKISLVYLTLSLSKWSFVGPHNFLCSCACLIYDICVNLIYVHACIFIVTYDMYE